MKTNKQGKIKVNKSGFKRSKFNWTHDVNTTFSWGEIQPTQCKMLIPGSKTTMQAQNLIRLSPMVAPTFGRVKYKTYNQFVSMAEIFPNWDAMMAQEPKSTAYGTKVPNAVPTIKLGVLSSWVLQGARATFYYAAGGDEVKRKENAEEGRYQTWYRDNPSEAYNGQFKAAFDMAQGSSDKPFAVVSDPWNSAKNAVLPNVNNAVTINLSKFGAAYSAVFPNASAVVLGAQSFNDLMPIRRDYVSGQINNNEVIPEYAKEVTFESADYVLEGNNNGCYFALAVELSDFGKRIRKVLQGCGYQINFTSNVKVNILPLFAQYKAYFDIFGLQLYQGWETTECAKMIKYIENEFVEDMDSNFIRLSSSDLNSINNTNRGISFMVNEIANMWYTDDADYVSAHINKLAVSPNVQTDSFISLAGDGILYNLNMDTPSDNNVNSDGTYGSQSAGEGTAITQNGLTGGHKTIDSIFHGEVDSEVLKRLYRWTNRNTILGRRIAEILRAQGLGKYVDECKSYYIGSTDTMVTISDVVSVADTDKAVLGEYGGKGLMYSNDQVLSFENDCYGYWITLATVIPEAGYTQGLDPTLKASSKMQFYHPDFDALGMELTTKETVVGNASISNYVADSNGEGFGFIPRYSSFKVAQNLTNGDFNRHGLRNVYMPYTLDKQLNINDYDVESQDYTNAGGSQYFTLAKLKKSRRISGMPVAGNVWRYPTKYGWLGNFNRIFYNIGHQNDGSKYGEGMVNDSQAVGWNYYNNDNFLSHSIYEVNCYAPMKPINESYGLEEDDSMRAGAEFTSKA